MGRRNSGGRHGEIQARLPLPVAGLLSEGHMRDVAKGITECIDAARKLGCELETHS